MAWKKRRSQYCKYICPTTDIPRYSQSNSERLRSTNEISNACQLIEHIISSVWYCVTNVIAPLVGTEKKVYVFLICSVRQTSSYLNQKPFFLRTP